MALRLNRNLTVRTLDATAAAALVKAEQSAFDPFLEGLAQVGEPASVDTRADANVATDALQRRSEGEARLVVPLRTGGEVSIGGSVDEQRLEGSTDTPLASELDIGLEQPLLRGLLFGAPLNPARRAVIELETADLQVATFALDLVRDVEIGYWNLVAAARREMVALSALATAGRLVEETRAREATGLADRIEILEAESARASRREGVILARQETEDACDDLLALLGVLGANEPDFVRKTEPFLSPPDPRDEEVVLAEIRSHLPDYQLALREVDRLKIDLNTARGDALPELGLFATGRFAGEESTYFRFLREKPSRDSLDWSLGVRVTMPLTFREERARVAAARARLAAGQLEAAQVDLELRLELRKARRAATAALARVEAARAARLLAEERFEQLRARYLEGLVPFRDLLPAQDTMEEERGREITARLDAASAAARLGRIDGSSIARHGIILKANTTSAKK